MIELDVVITGGYVDRETISKREEKGWKFVVTVPAKTIHPHALDSDKATIFSRYKSPNVESECTVGEINDK